MWSAHVERRYGWRPKTGQSRPDRKIRDRQRCTLIYICRAPTALRLCPPSCSKLHALLCRDQVHQPVGPPQWESPSFEQSVTLAPSATSRHVGGGSYVITKQLPERDGEFEYRIKSMSEPTSELRVRATLLANSHSPALGSLARHIHAEPHGTDHSRHQLVVDLPESGCDRSHNPAAFGSSRCLSAARGAADPSKRLGRRCSEREKDAEEPASERPEGWIAGEHRTTGGHPLSVDKFRTCRWPTQFAKV